MYYFVNLELDLDCHVRVTIDDLYSRSTEKNSNLNKETVNAEYWY